MATTYKVTYNANGGDTTSVPAAQTKTKDVALTLSVKTPKRSGCTFFGWNTKTDGTGTHYSPGATYTANASVTLYAMWLGVSLPSYIVKRTDSQGQEADEGTYGTLNASWSAVGTLASSIRVIARNVTLNNANITLTGNTTGTLVPGQTATGSVSALFGADAGQTGALDIDTRYLIRVFVKASTTSPYNGQTREVERYFEGYVDLAYITMDFLAGGHGVAFGNPASLDGFHCYMPAEFHSGLTASNIGTMVSNDASKLINNATGTAITSVTLDPGTWLIEGNVAFASNATGRRIADLATGSGSVSAGVISQTGVEVPAVSGGYTALHTTWQTKRTSQTTIYLNAYQDSGAALSVTGYIRAMRIQ